MQITVTPKSPIPRHGAAPYDPSARRSEHHIYSDGEHIASSWSRAGAKAAARYLYLRADEVGRAHTITVRTQAGKLVMDYPNFRFEGRKPEEIIEVNSGLAEGDYHDR